MEIDKVADKMEEADKMFEEVVQVEKNRMFSWVLVRGVGKSVKFH